MASTAKNKNKKSSIKTQRDRFVAFAFASADLFIETSPKGKIIFARGAAKAITGINDQTLEGTDWLSLFDETEHKRLKNIQNKSVNGIRSGPFLVSMAKDISKDQGILTAITLPNSKNLYVTLGLTNALMNKLAILMQADGPEAITTGFTAKDATIETITTDFKADDEEQPKALTTGVKAHDETIETITTDFKADDDEEQPEALTTGVKAHHETIETITTDFKADDDEEQPEALTTGFTAHDDDEFDDSLYNKGEFIEEAEAVFEIVKEQDIQACVTILDFGKTSAIPEENWAQAFEKIKAVMKEHSLGANSVAELGKNKYSFLHEAESALDTIIEKIKDITKTFNPDNTPLDITTKTIEADLKNISSEEAARSVFYAIDAFEKNGAEASITNLSSNLKNQVAENAEKLAEFKGIIERVDFDIQFQPIIELETEETTHFEILSRFRSGNPLEWVMFGEDTGLSADFDLAVVERTMNYIHYKAGTTRTKFSINISAKSIEDATFYERLEEQLSKREFHTRIMFEITNYNSVKSPKTLSAFINNLQNRGYEIALDSFNTEPLSIQILKKLPVDCVKISAKHIRKITKSAKETKKLENLVSLCKELNVKTIAKSVETQEQADKLKKMDIGYAQGFLFGKSENAPSFKPPKK